MIAARGLHAFSVAEAARRIGVQISAPYRHFSDRDELLLAVAQEVCRSLGAVLSSGQRRTDPPVKQLATATQTLIGFAAENQALYETLFAVGLRANRHPLLKEVASPIAEAFLEPAMKICRGNHQESEDLVVAIIATAHGHSILLFNGAFEQDSVATAKARAAAAVLALIEGRKHLFLATTHTSTGRKPFRTR